MRFYPYFLVFLFLFNLLIDFDAAPIPLVSFSWMSSFSCFRLLQVADGKHLNILFELRDPAGNSYLQVRGSVSCLLSLFPLGPCYFVI